jgi:hypothetical protein
MSNTYICVKEWSLASIPYRKGDRVHTADISSKISPSKFISLTNGAIFRTRTFLEHFKHIDDYIRDIDKNIDLVLND